MARAASPTSSEVSARGKVRDAALDHLVACPQGPYEQSSVAGVRSDRVKHAIGRLEMQAEAGGTVIDEGILGFLPAREWQDDSGGELDLRREITEHLGVAVAQQRPCSGHRVVGGAMNVDHLGR